MRTADPVVLSLPVPTSVGPGVVIHCRPPSLRPTIRAGADRVGHTCIFAYHIERTEHTEKCFISVCSVRSMWSNPV